MGGGERGKGKRGGGMGGGRERETEKERERERERGVGLPNDKTNISHFYIKLFLNPFSQTKNFRLSQTERVCRQQFQT